MLIRPATPADLSTLSALLRQTFVDAFGHEMAPAHLTHHLSTALSDSSIQQMFGTDQFLIALDDECCVGVVQVGAVNPAYAEFVVGVEVRASDLEMRRAYVQQGFQNQGIGQRLIASVIDLQAKAADVHLFLDVWETNWGAQRLYRNNGFELVGKMPETDPQGQVTGYEHLMVRRGR